MHQANARPGNADSICIACIVASVRAGDQERTDALIRRLASGPDPLAPYALRAALLADADDPEHTQAHECGATPANGTAGGGAAPERGPGIEQHGD